MKLAKTDVFGGVILHQLLHLNRKCALDKTELILILSVFVLCLTGAFLVPVEQCPDEHARQLLSDWMFKNGSFPTGDEAETIIPGWGFSYALRPYLSSIVAALFMRLTALFTSSPRALLVASRLCSVLSVTGCSYFCIKTGHLVFKKTISSVVFSFFVCFLPQVLFLGMYQNNDSLSLAAVSMIVFYSTKGCKSQWEYGSCIGLAIGFALALQAYYITYGWVLVGFFLFVLMLIRQTDVSGKWLSILKRVVLVSGICLLLSGCFFVRNAVLHNGDFLGLITENNSKELLESQGFSLSYSTPAKEGFDVISFFFRHNCAWLGLTIRSFIGCFGYMNIPLPLPLFCVYVGIMALGTGTYIFVVFKNRPDSINQLLFLLLFLSSIITFVLHFIHSYLRDYQPQGRYIITVALMLGYMIAYATEGIDWRKEGRAYSKKKSCSVVLTTSNIFIVLWFITFVCSLFTMKKML